MIESRGSTLQYRDLRQSIAAVLMPGLLTGIGCAGLSAASIAADTQSGADQLQEIVVTAEKRTSTIQETAISISAYSGEQLEAAGITTVEDLALSVPGVSTRTAGPGQTEYEMRGLTSSGGSTATVGFYLDETPLSASAVALNGRTVIDPELFDLNHAEVLRGPQGTLYGAGSMGGTIKLVTNPPKLGRFEGAADLNGSHTTGGDLNGGGSLMLNFPIGEIAALRVVTTEKYISGWIDRVVIQPGQFPFPTNYGACGSYHCTRGDVASAPVQEDIKGANSLTFFSTREALLIKPSEQFSMTATFMYQRIDAQGFNTYQVPPGNLAIYQPYDVKEPYYDQFKLGSLTLNYNFDGAQLTSNTSYWRRDVLQTQDSTEALQNIFNLTQFMPTAWAETDQTSQFSEELRLTSTGEGPLQWVGGLYFANLHSTYLGNEQSPAYATALGCNLPYSGGSCPPGQTFNINNGGPAANPLGVIDQAIGPYNILKQYAAFGEVSYRLTPELKLTAGMRYFDYQFTNSSALCGVGTGTGNASCQTSVSPPTSGSTVLPKLNLAYTPNADTTLYGTIAKGSRPGGDNILIPLPTAAQLAANPGAYNCGPGSGPVYVTSQPYSYRSDSVWSVEVGEKIRTADRRFTFNSDVYYVKWDNIQQVVPLSCGYPYNANSGTARTYGPEVELSARILTGLDLSVAGAYTVAEIYAPAALSGIAPGTSIINVPKYTMSASLYYAWAITGDVKGTLRIADSLVGPIQDVAYVRETLPSYNLLSMRAGIAKDAWTAYLVGTNLTNKHAELSINDTTFAWQQSTFLRATSNQPRTVGFDLQYKF